MKIRLLLVIIFFSAVAALQGQNVTISGKVIDETGETLPGAAITVEGTKTTVVSDNDGQFTVSARVGDKLKVSYVGYRPKEVEITSADKSLTVVMDPASNVMDEVVVVGYGSQKKSDIATAISSVNMEELAKTGSTQTLEALQGKVSGLQIMQSDGSLSGSVQFRMRGVNSITGGTQPLFVIDGVPMPIMEAGESSDVSNNPLLGLNPSDIESIEVLKDAAAAAIYGAKGSNGVVLITTKKGEANTKPKFTIQLTGGIDFKPTNKLKVLSPEEYAHKMLNYGTYGTQNVIDFWQNVIDTEGWNDPSVHNWLDEILQTAKKYEINAQVSGGSGGTNYMFSASYMNNTGLIRRSKFDRFTSRLNLQQTVSNNVSFGTNLSFSTSKDHNPTSDWSQSGIMLNALQRSPFLYYPGFSDIMNYNNVNIMSPLVAVEQVDINNRYDELNGNLWLSWNIINGLNFTTSGSYRRYQVRSTREWGDDTWFGQSEQGRMEVGNREENSWVWEARLQYNRTIGPHAFTVMGAFEASKWWMNYLYDYATNYEDMSNGIYGINSALVAYAPTYTYDSNKMLSWIGRATYSYDNRYILNASIRADGSSKFGKNNKWGYFPAVSLAWRASQEEFLRDVDFIDNLRLRASFGMTGNNQIPSYQSLSQLATNKVVYNGSTVEIGRYSTNMTNNDLKWESQKQYNVGFDIAIWRNRLQLTGDLYYKRVDDMLLNVNIPSTSGYESAWKNAGSLENKGLELQLTANWLRGDFTWTTDFNISMYRNKILKLDTDQFQQFYDRGLNSKITSDVVLRVGEPVGVYYGYLTDGVYNNDNEIANGYPGSNLSLGELKVVDVNGDGIIDSNDRVPIANVNPKHTGGIGNTFTWKGFDLYFFFMWSYGNDVINGNAYYLQGSTSINNIMESIYGKVWNTDATDQNFPLSGAGTWSEGVMRSDLVEDGSFLRLQTLSLGYTFPTKWIRPINLSKLRVVLTASNLWTWTKYSGFDPEANTGWGTITRIAPGLDMSPYPRPRSVSLSFEVGF
ncbi:MAG: TonB-dependent receptor [Bacteroidales bacterium]|nr:TonB-dependent receptor [Bacteroidales bacterium]